MSKFFANGVYPVMLTPFTEGGAVDYKSLEHYVEWHIKNGVSGLFAVCQSSEMFLLSQEERTAIARFVVDQVKGRIPVLASGHVSDAPDEQAEELRAIADIGVDAVILLTNRLAKEQESDEIWMRNLEVLLKALPDDIPLGFYECPYPYKRVLTPEMLELCVDTGRFYFIKDTCCNLNLINEKLEKLAGSQIKLYNANASTLLESMEMGAAGFSGVMANFHPDLYVWLCANYKKEPYKARFVADFLTTASMFERQFYPINAKYFQKKVGNFISAHARVKDARLFDETAMHEIDQLERLTSYIRGLLG